MKKILIIISSALLASCSIFGNNDVENAPYTLITSDTSLDIEVRNYESIVLVSTSMQGEGQNSAFRKLFKYISGANEGSTEIAMTAPVIMDNTRKDESGGTEIAMTAPVFINENAQTPMMSFVMPKDFSLATTPKPNDPDVIVTELSDYKVAAIQFSGTLSDSNVEQHSKILNRWISDNNYTQAGEAVQAGYNGPLTLPWLRRNEILIEIE